MRMKRCKWWCWSKNAFDDASWQWWYWRKSSWSWRRRRVDVDWCSLMYVCPWWWWEGRSRWLHGDVVDVKQWRGSRSRQSREMEMEMVLLLANAWGLRCVLCGLCVVGVFAAAASLRIGRGCWPFGPFFGNLHSACHSHSLTFFANGRGFVYGGNDFGIHLIFAGNTVVRRVEWGDFEHRFLDDESSMKRKQWDENCTETIEGTVGSIV